MYIDGSFIRQARKTHICLGNGAGRAYRQFAPGHTAIIPVGAEYLEYLGEADTYQSGSHHCMACARQFFVYYARCVWELRKVQRLSGTARGGAPVTRPGGRTAFAPEILRRRRAETQACRGIPTEALEAGAIAALVTAARAMTLATPTNMAARVVALYAALAPWREVTP